MNKKEYILFLFEGTKVEPLVFDNLRQYFLEKKEKSVTQDIVVSYGTVIYTLYKKFFIDDEFDEDLDLVTLLKPLDINGNRIDTKHVSEIYLFFDYDGHASNAKKEKLVEMLNVFDDETDKGKLYVSYPMVEALLHIKDKSCFSKVMAVSEKEYKKISRQNCNENLKHFNNYSKENWNFLISEHCKKANYIVNDEFTFPTVLINQNHIFSNQIEKYDVENNQVAVLSAFPLMLLDYYECSRLKENINTENDK